MSGTLPRASYGSADNGPGIPTVYVAGTIGPDGKPLAGGSLSGTDRSGSIAAGGTAQQAAPANAVRRGIFFQNISAADLWISVIGTASAGVGSVKVAAGGTYSATQGVVPSGAVSVFGATTGQAFTFWEF